MSLSLSLAFKKNLQPGTNQINLKRNNRKDLILNITRQIITSTSLFLKVTAQLTNSFITVNNK